MFRDDGTEIVNAPMPIAFGAMNPTARNFEHDGSPTPLSLYLLSSQGRHPVVLETTAFPDSYSNYCFWAHFTDLAYREWAAGSATCRLHLQAPLCSLVRAF